MANYHEISPLCVLDFYVHESQQRGGYGKTIFDFMLKFENTLPKLLAYDRPSPKLLNFLSKHFGLSKFLSQNNNYVIFNDYFANLRENTPFRNGKLNEKSNYNLNQNLNYNSPLKDNMNINSYNNQNTTEKQFIPSNSSYLTPNNATLNKGNNFASYGQQLVSNNLNNLNASVSSSTPNKLFENYYLNSQNTNYYDNIYSKKKINLLNDYLSSNKLQPDQYVR